MDEKFGTIQLDGGTIDVLAADPLSRLFYYHQNSRLFQEDLTSDSHFHLSVLIHHKRMSSVFLNNSKASSCEG